MKRRVLQRLSSVISVSLFAVAVVVIHHKLKGHSSGEIARQSRQVPRLSLLAALVLTVLNYLIMTAYDALALRYIRYRLAYRNIALASFIGYVFSNNATIIGGSAARYRIYSALGVSTNEVAKLVLFCGLSFWLGFIMLGGLVFVTNPQPVPPQLHLPSGSVRIIGMVFLVIVCVYMLLIAVRRRPVNLRGWEWTVPSVGLSAGQILIASLDWMLAAGVLYVLLPQEIHVGFPRFLTIFMLAQAAGLLSYVPGGLGVFETAILLLLADLGDNTPTLAAALLLYRLIYYILPLIFASVLLAVHEILPRMAIVRRIGVSLGRWGSAIVPQVLAAAVFVAGAILLFSGALPAVKGRLGLLRDLLGLPAIEVSHFLASVTGAALLILSNGLQRRLGRAYHVTVALLGAGMVLSLLKGLDYEEAVFLGIMLIVLLPCRGEFYRRASLLTQRFSRGWAALIFIVLLCAAWLGLFSYEHLDYSHDLWWQFTLRGDASRFLRATAAAVALVLLYALARLLVSGKPKPVTLDGDTSAAIQNVVRASRRTYANLAFLGDKQFVFSDNRDAFIMYVIEGRSWVAMGDPVGPEDRWEELAWRFIDLCDRSGGQPAFYQIQGRHLELYSNLGLSFMKLGEEARVSLPAFSLEGSVRKSLHQAHDQLSRQGYGFRLLPAPQGPEVIDRLTPVSDAWLRAKNTREKRFSSGSFQADYIGRCPVVVVENDNQMVAFANLWTGARKEELSVDLVRFLPGCPEGIMDFLFVELILWGQREGYQWFDFGMAPLAGLDDHAGAPLWSKAGALVFRHGEHFCNSQGLRQYKEKFDPQWQPEYLGCRGGLALPRILSNIATLISGGPSGVILR
jgi:phosphatidylglycerol lysyltransferase